MASMVRSFNELTAEQQSSIGFNPVTGEFNDSLSGDYLWSNANLTEAIPDVMTPSTWSLWKILYTETILIKTPGNHPVCGNICGRPYANLSLLASLYRAIGKDIRQELHGDFFGAAPPDIRVPEVQFSFLSLLLTTLPGLLSAIVRIRWKMSQLPDFVAETPEWCRQMRQEIQSSQTGAELIALWRKELKPYFYHACWMLRCATLLFSNHAAKLRQDLNELMGETDSNTLLSNLGGEATPLASMGPLIGLAQVARGEMQPGAYLEHYGHRGPHELELSATVPEDDPTWLDQQLAQSATMDVEALLAKQRAAFAASWQRFQDHYPHKVKGMQRRLEQASKAAHQREAVRSELTRLARTIRAWALRASELTSLGDDIFFLSLDEILDVLSGDKAATATIPARREVYERYCALPPYPAIINGRFDPFVWAADPNRRSDIFDSHAPVFTPESNTIAGFAGAAGRVDGGVRVLNSPEEGDQLQPGEILVAVTTNVGWTPLFPRAAAIVTDVGAPLSHAAIVARELGIPAVVGCGDATMRLRTGDRVLVDGGQGIVEILERDGVQGVPGERKEHDPQST
jgi:phosphohistidine swiveling domain-containing protein